jgi:hypothetical protein
MFCENILRIAFKKHGIKYDTTGFKGHKLINMWSLNNYPSRNSEAYFSLFVFVNITISVLTVVTVFRMYLFVF